MGILRDRAQQLKAKRPGYGDILDFYVKIRKAQVASETSLKIDPIKLKGKWSDEGFSLIRKEDFPVDVEASIILFLTLCRIGKTANPHMAGEVEKIENLLREDKLDLEELLGDAGKGRRSEQVADDLGLDKQVLSFLAYNSIRPSIEAAIEQLRCDLEHESWRECHCPVCGSLPSLNLLKGNEGKRYSLCSYCGFQWRIDRLSCAVCGNGEHVSLSYFSGEGEEAFRIDLCEKCNHYIKTIDYRKLETSDPALEDLATLHLDVLAVEKGYTRAVPALWSA